MQRPANWTLTYRAAWAAFANQQCGSGAEGPGCGSLRPTTWRAPSIVSQDQLSNTLPHAACLKASVETHRMKTSTSSWATPGALLFG